MQQLVSPNQKADVEFRRGDPFLRFPKGYSVAAQKRIANVRQNLSDSIEASIPFLIEALDDDRYCMTIDWADGDGYYNESVGEICRNVIASHLEIYRDKIAFTGPHHWHQYSYPISAEWFGDRRERKLYELQIEAIDWAIGRFEKDDDADPRFPREKQLADLKALHDEIAKGQEPAKPRGMYRMATRNSVR